MYKLQIPKCIANKNRSAVEKGFFQFVYTHSLRLLVIAKILYNINLHVISIAYVNGKR